MNAILVDFGSTYTKMTIVDVENRSLLYVTKSPSTVSTNALIGLQKCFDDAKAVLGEKILLEAEKIASSSAAGGLRMVIVGLTKELSMLAGKIAALGAGARVIKAYDYKMTSSDVIEINKLSPEIILLSGGTNGGDRDKVINCTSLLARYLTVSATIIYAGNAVVAPNCINELKKYNKHYILTENIYPDINYLNLKPVTEVIREVFMTRIIRMKGLSEIKKVFGNIIMPTPRAVLEAGNLLAQGILSKNDLLMIDIGGATTDVYSYCHEEVICKIHTAGLPETFVKRSVEGDLGLRVSVETLFTEMERDKFFNCCISHEKISHRYIDTSFVPDNECESSIDNFLGEGAVHIAVRRHAGYRKGPYYKGTYIIQQGRNLQNVKFIIGTGGPIINSKDPRQILKNAFVNKETEKSILLPSKAIMFLDNNYILYAMGLLSHINKDAAQKILNDNLKQL